MTAPSGRGPAAGEAARTEVQGILLPDGFRRVGLLMEPLDVLLFRRDGRPFDPGGQAESGLPTPQVLAGAVRSLLLRGRGMDLSTLNRYQRLHPGAVLETALRAAGAEPWIAAIRIRGPWLYSKGPTKGSEGREADSCGAVPEGPLVALPADLTGEAGPDGVSRVARLRPLPSRYALPGWRPKEEGMVPLWYLPKAGGSRPRMKGLSGWLDQEGLAAYLQGETPASRHVHRDSDLLTWEHRTGLAISPDTQTGKEGFLYSVRFLRLKEEICLYGELDLPPEAPEASELFGAFPTMPFGGESRQVTVRLLPEAWPWPGSEVVGRGDPSTPSAQGSLGSPTGSERPGLLTLLITPGLFRDTAGFASSWRPRVQGNRLVSAAVPGTLATSGWDIARRLPKPTRAAVPAGSVYLWETDRLPSDRWQSLADDEEDRRAGWGLYLRGRWSYA